MIPKALTQSKSVSLIFRVNEILPSCPDYKTYLHLQNYSSSQNFYNSIWRFCCCCLAANSCLTLAIPWTVYFLSNSQAYFSQIVGTKLDPTQTLAPGETDTNACIIKDEKTSYDLSIIPSYFSLDGNVTSLIYILIHLGSNLDIKFKLAYK